MEEVHIDDGMLFDSEVIVEVIVEDMVEDMVSWRKRWEVNSVLREVGWSIYLFYPVAFSCSSNVKIVTI
jgi:hypothetical protein